ncbi:hypothetical protein [Bradyrhizobium vignae]|uniref:Lipoprotein n=1 Tax=Bradyrhizobium vignae TaxID=1549949 RepID=A0A2U3PW23_9BRAD|nr:hypothetical protein [Bradyrhizobium vignae]MBP0111765.1 hypothetical protein [Bradyrhizobium vignae]RXG91320.1 hypothetical protein EAV90_28335 [Bradyrhizobium vignae]SPP93334.1 exported protein of unknown function [Bradyrhizobium vignae]
MDRSCRHSSSRYRAVTASMLICLLSAGACHAGCPNDYAKLDGHAEQATDAFNSAGASSRCMTARALVRAEQMLLSFVEDYQVQCVLDQEIIDVQRRRLSKAMAAQDGSCGH